MVKECTDIKMIEEFTNHKDEFVLSHFQVYKFMGIEEDNDNFYILKEWGGRISYDSACSCKLIFLKNILEPSDYERLEHSWKISEPFWLKNLSYIFMNITGSYTRINHKTGKSTVFK